MLLRFAWLLIFLPSLAFAAYPQLTGRVVDQAGIISQSGEQRLTALLADHEQKTTNQIVVVTVKTLSGIPIEDYGVKLGRAWGIGQKDKNNGVLFIIAPNDRQTRIEVGYGLEGTLTDALCNQIIQNIILPRFKEGNYEQGISDGIEAILTVLGGGKLSGATTGSSEQLTLNQAIAIAAFLGLFIIPHLIALIYYILYFPAYLLSLIGIGIFKNALIALADTAFGRFISKYCRRKFVYIGGSGRNGGSGFRGGGGSFGGGGSSGRW